MCGDGGSLVFLNDGNGNLIDTGQRLGSSNALDVALGDLDGDVDAYVVIAGFTPTPDTIFYNDGSGQFTTSTLIPNLNSISVVVGDFVPDLII